MPTLMTPNGVVKIAILDMNTASSKAMGVTIQVTDPAGLKTLKNEMDTKEKNSKIWKRAKVILTTKT
jgi:hypothetical protein